MFLNGILGGLVSITAGADQMSPNDAVIIGLIGGAIIVFAVSLLDKLKLDDPVGAIAVHLIAPHSSESATKMTRTTQS